MSDEANKKVFDWLTSKIKCTNCKKGFDFQLIKNKIKVKNLNYCHFLCEGQTKKYNYNYNYNYSYSNPKIYYQTCGNRLECLHNECIVKCGVCQKTLCQPCIEKKIQIVPNVKWFIVDHLVANV